MLPSPGLGKETAALENEVVCPSWWLTPVIPALWEAEVGGLRNQEFKTSLVNTVKPLLLKIQKISWGRARWVTPVIPALWEAEAEVAVPETVTPHSSLSDSEILSQIKKN